MNNLKRSHRQKEIQNFQKSTKNFKILYTHKKRKHEYMNIVFVHLNNFLKLMITQCFAYSTESFNQY